MSDRILQINFKFHVSRSDYESAVAPLAGPIAEVPGLLWKVWLMSEETEEAGGIYLFSDAAAFDNYWRTDGTPAYDGGPSGVARIPTAIYRVTEEWGTRLAALQSGDVDYAVVPGENEGQVTSLVGEVCDYATQSCVPNPDNPDGFLRQWDALPAVNRSDIFLNFNVSADSPYIGSGTLDGDGVPPDFMSDVNVRRAMATCFDYDAYINEVQLGKGQRNNGPIILHMLGYNPDGSQYEYDLDACATYLAQAWDGVLPETGFRFTFVYPETIPGGALRCLIPPNLPPAAGRLTVPGDQPPFVTAPVV